MDANDELDELGVQKHDRNALLIRVHLRSFAVKYLSLLQEVDP